MWAACRHPLSSLRSGRSFVAVCAEPGPCELMWGTVGYHHTPSWAVLSLLAYGTVFSAIAMIAYRRDEARTSHSVPQTTHRQTDRRDEDRQPCLSSISFKRARARGAASAAQRSQFIRMALLFVSAFLLSNLLHETSHAIVAAYLGYQPIVHGSYVDVEPRSSRAVTLILAAGPVASALYGLLFLLFFVRVRKSLFVLWLGITSLSICVGYLLTTPLEP